MGLKGIELRDFIKEQQEIKKRRKNEAA